MIKTGLPPIADEGARALILGSLPGDRSIAEGQYYAHPHNHFWRIMAAVLREPLPQSYAARTDMLTRNGVALWDVLRAARREGSLDSDIRDAEPNDLRAFLARRPGIRFILLNGGAAARGFEKYFGELQIPRAAVRSSSPVPARAVNTLEEKVTDWRAAWQKAGF